MMKPDAQRRSAPLFAHFLFFALTLGAFLSFLPPLVFAEAGPFPFVDFGRGLPDSGRWRQGFAVADMNSDGFQDIVHGPERVGREVPHIFLGNGKGDWREWKASFPDRSYSYGDTVAEDFNADGLIDIALAMHANDFLVLLQKSKGMFEIGYQLDKDQFSSRAVTISRDPSTSQPVAYAFAEASSNLIPGKSSGQSRMTGIVELRWDKRQNRFLLTQNRCARGRFGDRILAGHIGSGFLLTDSLQVGKSEFLYQFSSSGCKTLPVSQPPENGIVWDISLMKSHKETIDFIPIAESWRGKSGWLSAISILLRVEQGYRRKMLHSIKERSFYLAIAAGDLDGDGTAEIVAGTRDGSLEVFSLQGEEVQTRKRIEGFPGCPARRIVVANLDSAKGDEIVAAFSGDATDSGCSSKGGLRAFQLTVAKG